MPVLYHWQASKMKQRYDAATASFCHFVKALIDMHLAVVAEM